MRRELEIVDQAERSTSAWMPPAPIDPHLLALASTLEEGVSRADALMPLFSARAEAELAESAALPNSHRSQDRLADAAQIPLL